MTNSDHPYLLDSVQQDILRDGSREEVISWLTWNDSNGCFCDEDAEAEGMPRLTLQTARELMRTILREDTDVQAGD